MATLILNSNANAYISTLYPNNTLPDNGILYCGKYTTDEDIYRTLLKFNILPLPVNSIINSAYLKLYIKRNDVPNIIKPTKLYKLLNSFDEGTVNYSNQPTFDPTPITTLDITSESDMCLQWDITSLLNLWKVFPEKNFGLLIRGLESEYSFINFASRRYSVLNEHPIIEVNYELTQNIFAYEEEILQFSKDNESITSMVIPSGPNVATFGIKNDGPGTVSVSMELSNDMVNWINNDLIFVSSSVLAPHETVTLTSNGYMNYARLKFIHQQIATVNNTDIEDATIKVYKTLKY